MVKIRLRHLENIARTSVLDAGLEVELSDWYRHLDDFLNHEPSVNTIVMDLTTLVGLANLIAPHRQFDKRGLEIPYQEQPHLYEMPQSVRLRYFIVKGARPE